MTFLKRIKRMIRLSRLSRKLETFEPYETDENGNRIIRLNVVDDDYFLSPLSVDGVPCISDETAHYLEFYLKNMSIDSDEKLRFVITGKNLNERERNLYAKAIRNYYKEEFLDVQEDMEDNTFYSVIMGIVGLGLLFTSVFVFTSEKAPWLFVLLDLIGWVLGWEAIDLIFVRRPQMRKLQLQNLKILEADISFQTSDEDLV